MMTDLASLAHPLFRYGIPHPRRRFIPIPTDAHFILFDAERVGPVFTMHRITPGSAPKTVGRDDDFVSEFTLAEALQTTNKHYADWNRSNPSDPMDKGHQTGSQVRRTDSLVQHDVDSLAGCCPETPALNRMAKNRLESLICARAEGFIDVRCVQGPIWYGDAPRGKLASGQWIPDALFISCLFRPNMTDIHCVTWVMENQQHVLDVNLHAVSLDEIESLTGLVLWDQVKNTSFVNARGKANTESWWNK